MTAPVVDVYLTFGVGYCDEPHPYLDAAHPDGWLRVRGHTYGEALDAAFALTRGKHAFDYPADRFHPERFPRGELMFCDLTSGERPPEPMPEGLVERMQEAVRAEVAAGEFVRHEAPYPRRPFHAALCLAVRNCWTCTLDAGHEGPHSAGGVPDADRMCRVFAEWGDGS